MNTSAIEPLEGRRLMAASSLDTSFAGGGVATVSFKNTSADNTIAESQVIGAPDGSTYVLARIGNTVQVRRLTAAGAVDTAFAAKKKNLLVFPVDAASTSAKIEVDVAGRLLVLTGRTISRYTAAGDADAAFGTGGSVTLKDFNAVTDFDTDATNKIYVTGDTKVGANIVVGRLISRGKYDKTFDGDGLVTVPQPDLRRLTKPTGQGRLVRATDNGTTDTNDDGVIVAGGISAVSRPGRTVFGTEVVRLTDAGALVTPFGSSGVAATYAGESYSNSDGFTTAKTAEPTFILPNGDVTVLQGIRNTTGDAVDFRQSDGYFDGVGKYRARASSFRFGAVAATNDGGYVASGVNGSLVGRYDASSAFKGYLAEAAGLRVGYVDDDNNLLVSGLTRNSQRLNVARFLPAILGA